MDSELKEYILKNCRRLMREDERVAYSLCGYSTIQKQKARLIWTGSKRLGEKTELYHQVVKLEKKHKHEVDTYIAERIYRDHKEEIDNYCPNCGKLARTPFARQCHHCFLTWRRENRILVVLDLDETLIHSTPEPVSKNWDFELMDYKVYKRPGLDQFLDHLRREFDVAVWSSASDDYVEEMVEKIFPQAYDLKFVWGRSKCTPRIDYNSVEDLGYFDQDNHLNYSKPLKKLKRKLKRSLDQILIIDDTPMKCSDNYGNAIYPSEFNGDVYDKELEILWQYLYSLKDETNVRKIEKRGWQNRYK